MLLCPASRESVIYTHNVSGERRSLDLNKAYEVQVRRRVKAMKDYNDFFDEMIDVDDEAEAEAVEYSDEGDGFDDGDDDDDDDALVVRTAVLRKNDMLALLSLKSSDEGGQIVRFDPREPLPAIQRYDSESEALKWFRRSLAKSRRNGWSVVYDGEPLIG